MNKLEYKCTYNAVGDIFTWVSKSNGSGVRVRGIITPQRKQANIKLLAFCRFQRDYHADAICPACARYPPAQRLLHLV